jgi:branched-chain amino acid transport system ATP-binding protein
MTPPHEKHLMRIEHLSKDFGGISAINDLSLDVNAGELLGIIGPNGAGKTALINTITGFYQASSGQIHFEQQDITHLSIHDIAMLGIGRTFQNIRLFKRLSVLENVLVARKSFFRHPFQWFNRQSSPRQQMDAALACLSILNLSEKINQSAASLSYGDARRLEIARALAGEPKMLLLDEPAAGMNEFETQQLIEDIQIIRSQVSCVILIEHDMNLIRALSTRVVAMDFGSKLCEGTAQEVLSHPEVLSAYLGDEEEDVD